MHFNLFSISLHTLVLVSNPDNPDVTATHDRFLFISVCVFMIAVLIDAIVKNGSSTSAGADYMPPPPGWRDEDIGSSDGTFGTSSDEKKTYTEEQRQGVARCDIFSVSPCQEY